MKKIIAAFLMAVLLLGIIPGAGAESEFRFTRDNFPKLDGSTSMVPLGQGIASVLLGESREEVSELISFNRTTQSFRNLAQGLCELVIAAEPQRAVFDEMQSMGFAWKMEPIAREALVFVVNADNPVESLTARQIRDIYSGEITDWSQVGGASQPIEAFQRNPSSGSQVMMEKLVMQGQTMAAAPQTHVPGAMGELIEAVKSYDNSANAIGYTVYYYASDMRMADGLKILKIDGVEPSAETIRAEEYPFRNDYYCAAAADLSADSPAGMLYDWLVSEDGQKLLTSEGYVSAYSPGQAPRQTSVRMDDSRYIPYGGEPAVYACTGASTDTLTASGDLGAIYPYRGSRLYYSWSEEEEDYEAGSLWGFYTHDGLLITDPVYTSIRTEFIDWDDAQAWCWSFTKDGEQWGIASKDGSFVTDSCYSRVYSLNSILLCVRDPEIPTFDLYDRELKLTGTQADYPEHKLPFVNNTEMIGLYDILTDTYSVWIDGAMLLESESYINFLQNGIILTTDADFNAQVFTQDGRQILFGESDTCQYVCWLAGRFYEVLFLDDTRAVCTDTGSVYLTGFDSCWGAGDGFLVTTDGMSTWYTAQGRVRWQNIPSDWHYCSGSIFEEYTDGGLLLHDADSGKQCFVPDGVFANTFCDRSFVMSWQSDGQKIWWIEPDMTLTDAGCQELMLYTDYTTGAQVIRMTLDSGAQILMQPDLSSEIARGTGELGIQGDTITVSDDRAFTCLSTDGTVLFRYPYYGLRSGD